MHCTTCKGKIDCACCGDDIVFNMHDGEPTWCSKCALARTCAESGCYNCNNDYIFCPACGKCPDHCKCTSSTSLPIDAEIVFPAKTLVFDSEQRIVAKKR